MNLKRIYLSLLALAGACVLFAGEPTPQDQLRIIDAAGKPDRVRVTAVEKLGDLTDAAIVRDNRIVEKFLSIAGNKQASMFLRNACIEALGKLQMNADQKILVKYLPVFTPLLASAKPEQREHFFIRKTIADVYKNTLKSSVETNEAYRTCVEIAKKKEEVPGLRCACILVIGNYGAQTALDELVPLISDADPLVIEYAAAGLYNALNQAATETVLPLPAINKLVEMLDNKDIGPELKVNVMKVLAQLMRENKSGIAPDAAFPKICEFVAKAQEDKLVKGGIEALGIIGSAKAVDPLKRAYFDFMPAPAGGVAPPAGAAAAGNRIENSKETEVRQAVMDALASVLNLQGERTGAVGPDMKAVKESAALLVKGGEDDPAVSVQEAAIFGLRYMWYPKFKDEQREPIEMLIFKMRDTKTGEGLKLKILKPLQAITGQDFGLDATRWDRWFNGKFGAAPKAAAKNK
ncbi:MAG TPA: HEAT repeat domain-containing protein [Planctomycetota bacterium]|jgi:hypothetical protein